MTAQFLSRVQLSGQEVPAFTVIMEWLGTFAQQASPEE